MRRWRTLLSIAAPVIGLVWLGSMAIAGSRAPYSSGPLTQAHAFVEMKCEVCHVSETAFRSHPPEKACLTCHDAPAHTMTVSAGHETPACATCHREHQGRGALTATADRFCVDCHGEMDETVPLVPFGPTTERRPPPPPGTRTASPPVPRPPVRLVRDFPGGHPEFFVSRENYKDPGTIKFNHEVHAKADLRGPSGPETLTCATCHKPQVARVSSQQKLMTGLMAPLTYEQSCARCHQLYFDERIDAEAPHEDPKVVLAFVDRTLRDYIAANPGDINKPDGPSRRIPLNFPRPPEVQARTPEEWVERRAARARQVWERTCLGCHANVGHVDGSAGRYTGFIIEHAGLTHQWMPQARFDHAPHLMVTCTSCHAAEKSRLTSDVLMPSVAVCATCHSPEKSAAPATCATCHAYHDWTKAQPVTGHIKLDEFK
jgi:predicted CXXCH cytochrome family protein